MITLINFLNVRVFLRDHINDTTHFRLPMQY